MSLVDRLLGDPATLPVPGLERGLRRGSEAFAVRCVRELGERRDAPSAPLLALLSHDHAALRRGAARALGNTGRPEALGSLDAAARRERTEEGVLALAIARARCGAAVDGLVDELTRFDARVLVTTGGPRAPSAVTGGAPLVQRLAQALGDSPGGVTPRDVLLAARRDALARDPGSGDRVQALAALAHPADFPRFEALLRTAGRRGEHTVLLALGVHGDPRAADIFRDALRATDVDPGRGFAHRRIAATGLGRLGLRRATPWLVRALADEVADFEGRPGAGLGIQYPVRTNLLWALGEIGDPTAIPTLVAHLEDTHGSALGGFYLPAMDALWKLGEAAVPALRAAAARGTEVAAAHAVGVLAAIGADVSPWRADPRRPVRDVVARAVPP